MNLTKYSKLLKYLTIIPFLVGVATLVEYFIPNNVIQEQVVSKSENYRVKTGTTYTVDFKDINDQFTKEIYTALREDIPVNLEVTPIHKQIRSIILENGTVLMNDTDEQLIIYGFGVAFLLCGLAWFKSGNLKKRQALILAVGILVSFISLLRILFA